MIPLENLIDLAQLYVRELFAHEFSGHDYFHTERVWQLAKRIAQAEGADSQLVQVAALLHDVDDRKLSPQTCKGHLRAAVFLRSQGCDEYFIQAVVHIIEQVAYRGSDSVVPDSLEGKCVQDADRLDAIGAVGAARAFAYGGSRGRLMYDPNELPAEDMDAEQYFARQSTTINHFYEKLLHLKAMMNTAEAQRIAEHRHQYLEGFLKEFLAEWKGEC